VKTRHVTYYTISEKTREGFEPPTADSESTVLTSYTTRSKKRGGFEPPNPKDHGLNVTHLTTLLPLLVHIKKNV
jgi:hypothetical protein